MRHIIFLFLFAGLMACNPPEQPAPPAAAETEQPAVAESGEALGVAPATIVAPTVYAGWHLVRGAGAIQQTGGVFFQTKAWNAPVAGQAEDVTLYLRDLITALEKEGVLAGVDLTKMKSNWLIVTSAGASPRRTWVLDSRDLPQPPKE